LKAIDLRDNKIGQNGVKMIVESLERSSRVRHVYVHAGGKVEALGTNNASVRRDKFNLDPADDINYLNDELEKQTATTSVETVCVVDMRGNTKNEDSNSLKEKFLGLPITCGESVCNTSRDEKSQREGSTTKGIKKNKTAKPKISQEDREKRRKAKEIRDTIESEKRIREEGWNGRAGGLDISMMTKGIDKNSSFSSDSKRKAFDMTTSKDAISSRPESACTSIDSCTNESGIEPMKISPFAQDLQQL
jgi:myosin protein heavy chain